MAIAGQGATPALARDYGQRGAVFAVIELDMLTMIEARLGAAQTSGKLAGMQRELQRRTTAHVRRPPPVRGIVATARARTWLYDPTITVDQDLRDHRGNLIIARGARVNPLDTVGLRQSLVFLNGGDAAQVGWALRSTTALNAKLILVDGSAFELMGRHQRRFYHDQGGQLTAKFNIRHVPAVVEQAGRALKVSELVLPRARPAVAARPSAPGAVR